MEARYIPHALPSQTVLIFFLNGTIDSAISDIMDYFFGWRRPATN